MDGDDDDIVECTPGHEASKGFLSKPEDLDRYILIWLKISGWKLVQGDDDIQEVVHGKTEPVRSHVDYQDPNHA